MERGQNIKMEKKMKNKKGYTDWETLMGEIREKLRRRHE